MKPIKDANGKRNVYLPCKGCFLKGKDRTLEKQHVNKKKKCLTLSTSILSASGACAASDVDSIETAHVRRKTSFGRVCEKYDKTLTLQQQTGSTSVCSVSEDVVFDAMKAKGTVNDMTVDPSSNNKTRKRQRTLHTIRKRAKKSRSQSDDGKEYDDGNDKNSDFGFILSRRLTVGQFRKRVNMMGSGGGTLKSLLFNVLSSL